MLSRRPTAAVERAWSGEPGTIAWTRALGPLAAIYGAAASRARARAAGRRAPAPGAFALAFGGLAVGGTGKSSVVRWFARAMTGEAARRGAVLLRGYGAARAGRDAEFVPDYPGLDPSARVGRYGDDALAHRAALPRSVAVVVGADRLAAARAAVDGFGASFLLLDDGWEQRGLRWDRLYAVLDPLHPAGNGALLPAGPLRRPPATLREASAIVLVVEGDGALPAETRAFLERHAPGVPVHRFRRRLLGYSLPGDPGARPEPPSPRPALLTGIGSPRGAERFLRERGVAITAHAAFPNHASWTRDSLVAAMAGLARAGAGAVLISEKDEPRWPRALEAPLPVRVIRTALEPLAGDPDPLAALPAGPPEGPPAGPAEAPPAGGGRPAVTGPGILG